MTVDRSTKVVLTVIAVALTLVAARPWLPAPGLHEALAPAPAHAQSLAPKYEVTVPRAWGKFVGFSNNNLLLEGAEGMRIIDVEGKSPEYPKVKVLIRWQ